MASRAATSKILSEGPNWFAVCKLTIVAKEFAHEAGLAVHGWIMNIGVCNIHMFDRPSMLSGDGKGCRTIDFSAVGH